jgi:hypothetical protein
MKPSATPAAAPTGGRRGFRRITQRGCHRSVPRWTERASICQQQITSSSRRQSRRPGPALIRHLPAC